MQFSEESKLLLNNWEAYHDIKSAGEKLPKELSKYLELLFNKFKTSSWWSSEWHVGLKDGDQAYIFHDEWRDNKGVAFVWIGLEQFTPERVFGEEGSALLYVWVRDDQDHELVRKLRDKLPVYGSSGPSQGKEPPKYYVSICSLPNCLPEEHDSIDDAISNAVRTFVEFYASQRAVITGEVLAYRNAIGK